MTIKELEVVQKLMQIMCSMLILVEAAKTMDDVTPLEEGVSCEIFNLIESIKLSDSVDLKMFLPKVEAVLGVYYTSIEISYLFPKD